MSRHPQHYGSDTADGKWATSTDIKREDFSKGFSLHDDRRGRDNGFDNETVSKRYFERNERDRYDERDRSRASEKEKYYDRDYHGYSGEGGVVTTTSSVQFTNDKDLRSVKSSNAVTRGDARGDTLERSRVETLERTRVDTLGRGRGDTLGRGRGVGSTQQSHGTYISPVTPPLLQLENMKAKGRGNGGIAADRIHTRQLQSKNPPPQQQKPYINPRAIPVDETLDFTSEKFNPLKALYVVGLPVPYPRILV